MQARELEGSRPRRSWAAVASGACCVLVVAAVVWNGPAGEHSALMSSLPQLAPLQQLHWVNHVFVKVPKPSAPMTPLQRADQEAERHAQLAAKWGTLAATRDVFRSKAFTHQLEVMKHKARLSESKAEELASQINYEGRLLKVGRQGTNNIIAQAALAAHDASFVTPPTSQPEAKGDGSMFHNHEFVEVYPKPFRYAAEQVQSRKAKQSKALRKDEAEFMAHVQHDMRMKTLASSLKLEPKTKEGGGADDILDKRNDMDNGVDTKKTAAAAKQLATARAARLDGSQSEGKTNLAKAQDGSDDQDLLDNKDDMDNGVDTGAMQEAAKKLASSLVDKMEHSAAALKDDKVKGDTAQASSETKTAKAGDDADAAKKKEAAAEAEKREMRQKWSKEHPKDDAKVAELKKKLWDAEAEVSAVPALKKQLSRAEHDESKHASGAAARNSVGPGDAHAAAAAARKIEASSDTERGVVIANALETAVHKVVNNIVKDMSSSKGSASKTGDGAAVKAGATRAAAQKTKTAADIEQMAKGVLRASSKLEQDPDSQTSAVVVGKSGYVQLRAKILQAMRDEESHKNAAQLLQAQAVAERRNAMLQADHEAALDYPGASLSEPHQEAYL
jgi:hypothetical protein